VWVSGHCEIDENEMVDEAAKRGCELEQDDVECLRSSVRFCVKRVLERRVWKHERSESVWGCLWMTCVNFVIRL